MSTVLDAQGVVEFLSGKKYPVPCKFKVYEPGDKYAHVLDGGPSFYVLGPMEKADEKLLKALSFEITQIAKQASWEEDIEGIEFFCSSYGKSEFPEYGNIIIGRPLIYFNIISKNGNSYLWAPIPDSERTVLVKVEKYDPVKEGGMVRVKIDVPPLSNR